MLYVRDCLHRAKGGFASFLAIAREIKQNLRGTKVAINKITIANHKSR